MPDSPLLSQAIRYRLRLDSASQRDLDRLIAAYEQLAGRLKDKIDLLVMELAANLELTTGQVARMGRYKDLVTAIANELQKYGVYLETELGGIANAALSQSVLDMRALVRLSAGGIGITGGFNALPVNAIKTLLGFLEPDGPLYQRLHELAPLTAQTIADKILEGVGLGYNPQKVGRTIVDDLGQGLTSAMRWARTTQMYTYREAGRATMAANANILDGWVWFAQLDETVPPCESCLANHGQLFGLDEVLDDHWNGRCCALPHVAGDDNPVTQSGEEWFDSLDEAKQAEILGAGKLAALRDGQFNFSQLSQQVQDEIWGTMRTGVSLKDLVGE